MYTILPFFRMNLFSSLCKTLKVGYKKFQVIWKLDFCVFRPMPYISTINNGSVITSAYKWTGSHDIVWDQVYPDLSAKITTKIDDAKRSTDKIRLEGMFHIGYPVSKLNFQGRPKWLFGILEEQIGPLIFSDMAMEKTCGSYSHEYSNRTLS